MKFQDTFSFYARHPNALWERVRCSLMRRPPRAFQLESLLYRLRESPTIIEAGASRGMDTVRMATAWRTADIFAFEPEPDAFAQLVESTKQLSRVHPIPAALGAHTGTSEFYVSSRGQARDASDASSLKKPTLVRTLWPDLTFERCIEVETVTLSDFMKQRDLDQIDFMWLDMQGMELDCLKASAEVLCRVKYIYMEVLFRPLYEDAPLYPKVRRAMKDFGFQVRQEYLNRVAGDVLFERRI